jgi:hypothetical protein
LKPGYVYVEFPPAGAGDEVLASGSRTWRMGRGGMTCAWARAAKVARRSVVAMVLFMWICVVGVEVFSEGLGD